MTPRILVHTWEVMALHSHSGDLKQVHYPGVPPAPKQYASLVEAERFIERHWDSYTPYNDGVPVIVRRG